ncbi:fibronectin type III domain-containing protein [Streptomyces sp. NPDC001215]
MIGGLRPGTSYTVTVAAVTAAGTGPAATVTARTAP